MADNKKYYYLKLKDNFFDTDAMVVLESMPDGYLYSNILLKLYLRSLKTDGKLMFNGRIPYNSTILAQVTRHNVGVVEKALQVFKDLDLIDVLDNGAIYMIDIQNFIGKSSTEADRQRQYYQRLETEKKKSCKKPCKKSTPEIEIELEIEKDIELDKEIDNRAKSPRFVPPTVDEVQKYCNERNNQVDAERFVDFYESKGWMVGKNKMKNWKAAVRNWEQRDGKKKDGRTKSNYATDPDKYKEYESITDEELGLI